MAESSINLVQLRSFMRGTLWPGLPSNRFEFLLKLMHDEDLTIPMDLVNLERPRAMNEWYRRCAKLPRLIKQHKLTTTDLEVIFYYGLGSNAFWLHYLAFIPTLQLLASDRQLKKLIQPAEQLRIFGCYCQTEIAHGSDVQNLQTVATYDKNRKIFDIHSPSVHATKWWPAGLGLCSTHALLMARLIIEDSDYGVHPFFVRIRDSKTLQPMPGVSAGDLGPKMGLDLSDTGYLRFNHVSAPHSSLLSRYFEVTEAGEYILKNADAAKHIYSGVVFARLGLTKVVPYGLASAVRIALKYSATRTQFRTLPETPTKERQLLDYQLQQYKLFPLLASTVAMYVGHKQLVLLHKRSANLVKNEDFSLLKDVHVLSSCYKVWFTWWSARGIEECRKACGGHGVSKYSAFFSLYSIAVPCTTLDGDNIVLALQVSKALYKAYDNALQNKPNTELLSCIEAGPLLPLTPQRDSLDLVLRAIVLARVRALYTKGKALDCSDAEKWAQCLQVDSIAVSRSFCVWTLLCRFNEEIASVLNSTMHQALTWLMKVFGISEILRSASVLFAEKILEPGALAYYRQEYMNTIRELRPHCLVLSEAATLGITLFPSALDGAEGHPYDRLLALAQEMNAVNDLPVSPGIQKYIKPLAKL